VERGSLCLIGCGGIKRRFYCRIPIKGPRGVFFVLSGCLSRGMDGRYMVYPFGAAHLGSLLAALPDRRVDFCPDYGCRRPSVASRYNHSVFGKRGEKRRSKKIHGSDALFLAHGFRPDCSDCFPVFGKARD